VSIKLVGILNSKLVIDSISNLVGKLFTFLNEINVKVPKRKKINVLFKNLIL
jgi:hypothetical protein